MDIKEIEQLVRLLEKSQISSLEVEEGDKRIKLKKQQHAPLVTPHDHAAITAYEGYFAETGNELGDPGYGQPAVGIHQSAASATPPTPVGKEVKSPMVGVYYEAPSPDEEAFVKVGDTVKSGDVLCIIEAMKLMNEITAECDGQIAEICVENGDVVEFGQVLLRIV